jgi:hypothetical protein
MRGAVRLDPRARQWPQAWPSDRSAQERALAVVVKTAKLVLSSARALWGNPDCRFLSVTHITAQGSDLA